MESAPLFARRADLEAVDGSFSVPDGVRRRISTSNSILVDGTELPLTHRLRLGVVAVEPELLQTTVVDWRKMTTAQHGVQIAISTPIKRHVCHGTEQGVCHVRRMPVVHRLYNEHIAHIPLGSSRHVSTRSTCRASRARRVERVEPCCSTSSTQPKCMGSTRLDTSNVSSRVET